MSKQVTTNLYESNGETLTWVKVNLTPEEFALTQEDQIGLRRTHNLGYIGPAKVINFYCNKCEKFIAGSPELKVRLDFEKFAMGDLVGSYYFVHDPEEHDLRIILSGPILRGDVEGGIIKPEYVERDNLGRVVPITRERISGILENILQTGKNGPETVREAEMLAEVADFDFREEIQKARELLKQRGRLDYQNPENLREVFENIIQFGVGEGDSEEGTYMREVASTLRRMLPYLRIPEELVLDASKTLELMHSWYCERYSGIEQEIQEKREEIEELESDKKEVSQAATGVHNFLCGLRRRLHPSA